MLIKTAVILAAGKGQRLDRPDSPKPLVKVGNQPMILRNIKQLQKSGVNIIFIIIGHRGEEIKKELTDHPEISADINYIKQDDYTSSGMLKSVISVKNHINEPFFLLAADVIIEKNPYYYFTNQEKSARGEYIYTLVGANKEHFQRSGARSRVYIKNGNIKFIDRELTEYNGLETGIYYFPPKAFNILHELEKDEKVNTLSDALQRMVDVGKVKAVTFDDCEWFDVNTPATHTRAEMFIRNLMDTVAIPASRNKMKDPSSYSNFYRNRLMRTDIIIKPGLIGELDKIRIIPENRAGSRHFILTDEIVDALYGEKILNGFSRVGYRIKKLVIPAGEDTKNINMYAKLADDIFSFGMDKNSIIISLGGGVINNISGFLASTLYRGIGLIHIPTTMMAQVDAAIDFKQAVNSHKGKNLLGSYWPAMRIAIDPEVLLTLERRHINNGIAESIKHALTQDHDFLQFLYDNKGKRGKVDFLEQVVRKTIELKVPLLNGDVDDDYNEMLPQYAHSVCHAVEHLSSYELLHGEALAVGMCVTAEIARLLKICGQSVADHHYSICHAYELPTIIPDYMSAEDICDTIRFDKHHVKGNPHMALIEKIGSVWNDRGIYSAPIDYSVLKRAININKDRDPHKSTNPFTNLQITNK